MSSVINLKRGDTLRWTITFTDSAGTIIDVTGHDFLCQARRTLESATTLFDLSVGSGITLTDPTNGEIELFIADTTGFGVGSYFVDIQRTDTVGDIQSTDTFKLNVITDVSR